MDPEKLARYDMALDALGLELFDETGRRLGTDRIRIDDLTVEEGPGALELEVTLSDRRFWESRSGTSEGR